MVENNVRKPIHWRLTLFGLMLALIFASLGFWQLSRAREKEVLLATFDEHTKGRPLQVSDLIKPGNWRFYKTELKGTFDNAHTFLLDNKTYEGKIGYEVYTPFKVNGLKTKLLVDRGFIPITTDRAHLPLIRAIQGKITLVGMLNLPPVYRALGNMADSPKIVWPMRIEYINLDEMGKLIGEVFYPDILLLEPKSPYAYAIEWKVVVMGPLRHRAYAVQWFALSLTLLILSVVLNIREWRK